MSSLVVLDASPSKRPDAPNGASFEARLPLKAGHTLGSVVTGTGGLYEAAVKI
jgi:hypothetical protein